MDEFYTIPNNSSENTPRQPSHYNRRVLQRKRQRRNRRILLVTLSLSLIVIIIAVVFLLKVTSNNELLGTWQYNEYTKYEFNKDGTGCLCADDVHYEYNYKLSGSKLTMDFVEDVVTDCEYTFEVESDKLTLTGGDGTDGGTYRLSKMEVK